MRAIAAPLALCFFAVSHAQTETYTKYEYMIPMRDGVRLYTAVYVPEGANGASPILLQRTPYSAGPYGPNNQRRGFGGSTKMRDAKYIFAYQDVRGKYMSEGKFENLRPQLLPTFQQSGYTAMKGDIDESTDTYDTVDYLIKNVPGSNKRVGLWGISYPGGYAALGAMSRHPALRAVSPQAPTSDWFLGDDMHHNGAFFLQDFLSFFSGFGVERPEPGAQNPPGVRLDIGGDAYRYFLDLGGLANVEEKLFKGRVPYWQDVVRNDAYNDFWQSRSVPSGLRDIKCAMLWVGGFFDAEDCWGPLACFKSAEEKANQPNNWIVMGPWYHGMWAGPDGSKFHVFDWESNTSKYFQDEIEFPFFDAFLRGDGKLNMPKATMFDAGAKQWRRFNEWPPKSGKVQPLSLQPNNQLAIGNGSASGVARYTSDPANPVPYQDGNLQRRSRTYMLDDQRFAAQRKDVLMFQTPALTEDLTLAGTISADLYVEVSGTDCDFVAKLIDVFPADAGPLANFAMLVRGEVMRAKFRNSFSNPSPLVPNQVEHVPFSMPDICYTFKKGHRVQVQIQSSWFPLVDRNPHKFMNIFTAKDEDFKPAQVTLHLGGSQASRILATRMN